VDQLELTVRKQEQLLRGAVLHARAAGDRYRSWPRPHHECDRSGERWLA
jgi:hypothetical protein